MPRKCTPLWVASDLPCTSLRGICGSTLERASVTCTIESVDHKLGTHAARGGSMCQYPRVVASRSTGTVVAIARCIISSSLARIEVSGAWGIVARRKAQRLQDTGVDTA